MVDIPTNEERSEFETWAEEELRRAGLFDEDSDYDGLVGRAVMDLVHAFADQGHSGFSAHYVASIFERLVERKPLTPLSDAADEWMHIEEDVAGNAITWQSRRAAACFSTNGGRTYYDLDERLRWPRRMLDRFLRRIGVRIGWQLQPRHTTVRAGKVTEA